MISSLSAFSQEEIALSKKDSTVVSAWILGLGYNIVDDSATPFGGDILNIKESWNSTYYPNSISLGRSFTNGLMLKTVASYNKYNIGKLIDGSINLVERDYYAIDALLSYDLNKWFGETGWFDPFLQLGGGYSSIGSLGRATGNLGIGFNIWLNDRWGININTMGKWGLKNGATRQIQHSAGLVYRFAFEKELTKKGEEKLALIAALEKEKNRINDSIVNAKKEEEKARFLADQLAREKEKSRLAQLEKERQDQKEKLQGDLDALGNVNFAFNSSYLNKETNKTLDELVEILNTYETLVIKIASFTDSRGTDAYNLWLSERRVNTTVGYLLKKGIAQNRLEGHAYGEKDLLNECDDHTYCPESKHKVNRRSEFSIISF